jgi:hypothetical protein
MLHSDVKIGDLVEVVDDNGEISTTGEVTDKLSDLARIRVTKPGKSSHVSGESGTWFYHRLRRVAKAAPPAPSVCTCDIQQLLWGTRGCVCGVFAAEQAARANDVRA